MNAVPIKKSIEPLLREHDINKGVFKIEGKGQYLKLTSKINLPPVQIPSSAKNALEDITRCAKAYKTLIDAGFYSPQTKIAVYKDDEDNLSLLVVMPELVIKEDEKTDALLLEKLSFFRNKFNHQFPMDLTLPFNWGYDKDGKIYAHDLHIGNDYYTILRIANKMGIK